jgi:minor extracellular serine protease Vpr
VKQTRKWLLPVVLCTSLLVTGMGFVVAPKGNLVQVRLERNRVAGKLAPGVPANGGKVVQVIVEMSDLPVVSYEKWGRVKKASVESESTYRSHLQQKQKSLLREMKKRSPKLELKRTYDTVFSGIAVNVRADDVDRLAVLPEVKKIYPVHKYKVMANEGDALVGAPQAWKEKDGSGRAVTGKGVKVAVIDTGVDTSHPDLKGKVVGGYDFVKNDPNPQDENGHGTHVAGIIAGNGKVKGVAPGASLLAYRVLDAEGIGTDANILAAIDQAVKDGANVMNLSLGSDVNVPEDPLSWALTRAAEQGVVAVVAAGNAGPDDWTVGSPGAAPSVISVGASTLKRPEPVVESVGYKKKF